jgi:hypothetical protein
VSDPILTLEPLIEAVRAGVEGAGWALSGLQKTTSHQFEGRWEGESTRSAYLFFHSVSGPEWASLDVYLDETGRGLTGNLALVVDLAPPRSLGPAQALLKAMAELAGSALDDGLRRPLTLRFRLSDVDGDVGDAETEVRFKARLARGTLEAGEAAVRDFSAEVVAAFEQMLRSPELQARAWADED